MDFNFNKKGKKYSYCAVASDRPDFNTLGDMAAKYLVELQQIVSKKHQEGDNTQKKLMVSSYGCIERLTGFLLQSKRLAEHAQEICKHPFPDHKGMVALRNSKALFDFESFLFNGRAVLDRLTFYLAHQVYNVDCSKFNKLINVLNNFERKDDRAGKALTILNESLPHFRGLLIDAENGVKSLRSRLIHKSTTIESTTCAFTIHFLPDGRAIRFDHEIQTYPLMGSAWSLSKYVPFLSLNILGIYLDHNDLLPLRECEPIWENRLVHFSQYIDSTPTGLEFSIVKMVPSGVEIMTRLLKPRVLQYADTISTNQTK